MEKAYALAMFDTHAGHKLGLMNPKTMLLDEGPRGEIKWVPVRLNLYQEYLWNDIYIPGLKRVYEITKGFPLIALLGGDITHGNKFPEQVATASEYNQVMIAEKDLEPVLQIPACKKVRMAAGTGAHEFTEHSGLLLVAEMLRKRFSQIDVKANYHGVADILGYTVDYAHHGPGEGIRVYLNGNNVRYYLSDLMIRCLGNNIRPPDLVLRGHVHGNQDETFTLEKYSSRIFVIPSMCGMSFHARKVTRSKFIIHNGFALFEIADGKLTNWWKFYLENDVRTQEKLL